jgi:hypothetical protein
MNQPSGLFKRQAEWQAARRDLSWPEKIRMAEAMRATLNEFRRTRRASDKQGYTGDSGDPTFRYRESGR